MRLQRVPAEWAVFPSQERRAVRGWAGFRGASLGHACCDPTEALSPGGAHPYSVRSDGGGHAPRSLPATPRPGHNLEPQTGVVGPLERGSLVSSFHSRQLLEPDLEPTKSWTRGLSLHRPSWPSLSRGWPHRPFLPRPARGTQLRVLRRTHPQCPPHAVSADTGARQVWIQLHSALSWRPKPSHRSEPQFP